jgi:1-acyl-sn-glycerol-3-phosphate acyltransferase
MSDSGRNDLDIGVTAEFSAADARQRLPSSPADDLRQQLPGLEPERQITDWGRSQRVDGMVDRTVFGFLYHYWFRVEIEGVENVPGEGGALLLANHAGTLPADGAMIVKAVRDHHPQRRTVHLAAERSFRRVPGLGMLAMKLGRVPAHPANLQRLLFDERELVLAFPEGAAATRKPLKERYRLRPFSSDLVSAARTAHVPIVPVAVLGSEESAPSIAGVGVLRRLPSLPLTPGVPLPAKFRLRFLERIDPDQLERPQLAQDLRALIQENLLEMVAARRSVWLG